jgi:hypothetical protein
MRRVFIVFLTSYVAVFVLSFFALARSAHFDHTRSMDSMEFWHTAYSAALSALLVSLVVTCVAEILMRQRRRGRSMAGTLGYSIAAGVGFSVIALFLMCHMFTIKAILPWEAWYLLSFAVAWCYFSVFLHPVFSRHGELWGLTLMVGVGLLETVVLCYIIWFIGFFGGC